MSSEIELQDLSVVVDGMRLHYTRAGRGPALVMVHGLVGSARNWDQNIRFLAHFHTVYALDLANMGASERVSGIDPGLEASADRIAACMDALGIEDADIAGHSHGGAISMMLAARHPGRVRRLVLFAPANPYCDLSKPLIAFYNTRAGGWFALLIPFLPRIVHAYAHRRMYVDQRKVTAEMLEGYTAGMNAQSIEHVLGIVRRWSTDMSLLREALSRLVGLPVLLIWGDRDGAVGLSSGQKLADTLGARLMVIPGVGHLPFAETPEICNIAVRDWLRR